jgi:hypothetical protein
MREVDVLIAELGHCVQVRGLQPQEVDEKVLPPVDLLVAGSALRTRRALRAAPCALRGRNGA